MNNSNLYNIIDDIFTYNMYKYSKNMIGGQINKSQNIVLYILVFIIVILLFIISGIVCYYWSSVKYRKPYKILSEEPKQITYYIYNSSNEIIDIPEINQKMIQNKKVKKINNKIINEHFINPNENEYMNRYIISDKNDELLIMQ